MSDTSSTSTPPTSSAPEPPAFAAPSPAGEPTAPSALIAPPASSDPQAPPLESNPSPAAPPADPAAPNEMPSTEDGVPGALEPGEPIEVDQVFVLGGGSPRYGALVLDLENYDHAPNIMQTELALAQQGFRLVESGEVTFDHDELNADGYSLDLHYTATVVPAAAPVPETASAPFLVDNTHQQAAPSDVTAAE